MGLLSRLTDDQLQGLKSHKYNAQGVSVIEPFLQPYWRWLVTKVPLWVAPNLITLIGLLVNVATTIPLVVLDGGVGSVAPSWCYITCAAGFFVYQSLDAIDGKQARRTGSSNQLGELFDHGCDALSTFLIAVSGVSAVGMQDRPVTMLVFVVLLLQVNFTYHWEAYVSGVLHFNYIDVTEGQLLCIILLLIRGTLGIELWQYEMPLLGVDLKTALIVCTIGILSVNLLRGLVIIAMAALGRNRVATVVANTSVVTPSLSLLVLVPAPFLYFTISPLSLSRYGMLVLMATCLPTAKAVINMILAGMTKTPYSLLDSIMLVPWLACLTPLVSPVLLPRPWPLLLLCVWVLVDIVKWCVVLCLQVSTYLQLPILTLPKS